MAKFIQVGDTIFNADEILSIFHKRETDMVEGSDGFLRSTTVGYSITVLTKHQFNTKIHYSKEEKEKMENDFEIIRSMLRAVSQ